MKGDDVEEGEDCGEIEKCVNSIDIFDVKFASSDYYLHFPSRRPASPEVAFLNQEFKLWTKDD